MSDLGKAIYMAASVFLFIIAATTSIFLYNTLNSYLETSTTGLGVTNRAEAAVVDGTKKERDITRAEIYITLFNMEQMHIEELSVNEFTVSKDDVSEQKGDYKKILNLLKVNGSSKKYTYSSSNNNVKYKTRS